ncbi:hypothetical protein ACQ4M3_07690 [Leptolyngbya sp. AN03gr2]|uniref:hypothetical protein n=1 Tax=unclassified Leptolyngbya TaxID=2650499 RepID=UPI003D316C85
MNDIEAIISTIFCANCDAEAKYAVQPTGLPVCLCCKTAYEWGQSNPEATFLDIATAADENKVNEAAIYSLE